jgi:glycosyltransferase involved in cell wall biosynthesis
MRELSPAARPRGDIVTPERVLYSFPLRVGLPGVGATAWHQVEGLTSLGVQVTLCCGSLEKPLPGLHRLVETMRVGAAPIPYRLLGDDRSFRLHDWRASRELRRAGAAFDVLHGWPLGSLRTLQVARQLGVRCFLERPNAHTAFAYAAVAREHETIRLPVPASHSHAFSRRRLAREEEEYQLADGLLCPSDFVAKTFLERGFGRDRIARHQYGYAPERVQLSVRRRDDSPFTAIFIGRCEPRKGLHYALQAWHRSGAAETGRFIICGQYVPGYREFLEPLLRHPSVENLGFVADVGPLLMRADVLVLPSIEEGSALVTYEARGAGCVALVSEAAGAVGEDGIDILLHPPGDVQLLTKQMKYVRENREALEALRQRSVRCLERLTWAHAARTLLAAYGHSAAGDAGPLPSDQVQPLT